MIIFSAETPCSDLANVINRITKRKELHVLMTMTVKGGNSPACAACKYQRRRCSRDCILAPFFPATQTKAFQNAHRLFGVANMMKILKKVTREDQKEEAMQSIKYEADIRERYPVHGCLGIIRQLSYEIKQAEEQLQDVYEQLNIYRGKNLNYRSIPASDISSPPLSSNLKLGIINNSDIELLPASQQTPQSLVSEIPFLSTDEYDDESYSHHFHLEENKSVVGVDQLFYGLNKNNNNSIRNFTAPSNIYQNLHNEMSIDNTTITDDKLSYIETKELSETSSVSSLREFQLTTSKN